MHYLTQINIGSTPATLIGVVHMIIGIIYFVFMIAWLIPRFTRLSSWATTMYLIQIIFVPIALILSGFILTFQGWRLDPILQLGQFLISLALFYFLIKDLTINAIYQNRQN